MANPYDSFDASDQRRQLSAPDPAKPLDIANKQLSNRRTAADLEMVPLERQSKALDNAGKAQGNTLDRGSAIAALTKQFGQEDAVASYRQILPNVAKALASPDTPAGDLNVIYAYVKSNDPIGAVRGEDAEAAKRTAALVDQWKAKFGMLKDGDRMPPKARREMVEALRATATQFEKGYAEIRERYSDIAQASNLPPNLIIGPHEGGKYNDLERSYVSQITGGSTQTNVDKPLTATLDSFIKRGAPFEEANRWAMAQGGDPLDIRSYSQAVRFAKSNPNYQGSLAEFTRTTPTSTLQQIAGSIANDRDVSAAKGFKQAWDRAAVGLEGAYNAVAPSALESNSASDAQQFSQNFFADKGQDQTAETMGRLAGATLFSAPLRGPMAAGAVGNLLMTDSTGWDAVGDATVGAVGGKVGDSILRGGIGLIAPQARESAINLSQQGIRLSPGQIVGGRFRNLEDRLASNPVLGPKIDEIHNQGLIAANRVPAERSLSRIGQTLPADVPAGHKAVGHVKQAFDDEYGAILNGKSVSLDPSYVKRLNVIGQRSNLRPQEFSELADIVQREIGGAFQTGKTPLGAMSGRDYKALDERLGDLSTGFLKSDDPYRRQLGQEVGKVKDQTRALARRQDPEMGARLRAADEGYADYAILRRAAASSPEDGIFGAGQLRSAVKAQDRSVGKGATARGEARMQDFASDMSLLPSQLRNSGTSDREQVNQMAPWIIGALLKPLYSETAEQIIARSLLRRPGPQAQRVADRLSTLPRGLFGAGTPLAIEAGLGN